MKVILFSLLLFFLAVASTAAGGVSYVVVQRGEKDSLVRVSADGQSVTTIASGAAGLGLTVDRTGDYIVVAESELLRVTRSGVVTRIATAPQGSEWAAVAADPGGDLIVADRLQPVLFRVSKDGQSVVRLVKYPGTHSPGGTDTGLTIDKSGDYLLLRIGDDNAPHFYRITPAGRLSEIPLTGAAHPPAESWRQYRPSRGGPSAVSGGPIIPDGSGNYLFLDDSYTRNVFRLTAAGAVTKFAHVDNPSCCKASLARNSDTGEIVIVLKGKLLRVSADGSTMSEFGSFPNLRWPTGVIAESDK